MIISNRIKRALSFRKKILNFNFNRLSIFKSNKYVYIQIYSLYTLNVIASSSSIQKYLKYFISLNFGKNKNYLVCAFLAKCIAFKALSLGLKFIIFDKSGYRYHGFVKIISKYLKKFGLIF